MVGKSPAFLKVLEQLNMAATSFTCSHVVMTNRSERTLYRKLKRYHLS